MSLWLQSWFFFIPILQSLHIASIAVLFGSTLMVNLRILRLFGNDRTIPQMIDRFQRWIWRALVVLVVTGVLLVISEPVRDLVNAIFWLKMTALLASVLASLWFQHAVRLKLTQGDAVVSRDLAVRIGAVALILLSCSVMTGGRWIAYAPV